MTLIQIRRGNAAAWTAANPILAQGEMALEIDTFKVKVGDGSTAWTSLTYMPVHWDAVNGKPTVIASGADKADARSAIDAEYTGNRGQALGYASLDAAGKVPYSQLPASIMSYQGTWSASANTPTLADGTGDTGDVYRVSVAGTQNLGSGSIAFGVGDYVIYNGSTWEKSDSTDAVASVNGYTGVVSLTKSDVGLSAVDNTADADKPVSTATSTALSGKEPTITAGSAGQYWTGSKTWSTLNAAAVSGAEATANKDAANGYAGLDASSKLAIANIPTGTTSSTVAIGDDSRITGAEQSANKGTASGYCGLDGSSKVAIGNLPTGTTSTTVCIGNDSRLSDARTPTTHTHAVADINASTSTALGVGSIELGHASDTTLTRSAAGVLAVEGVDVVTTSGTQTLTNKTATNPTITNYTESVVAIGTVTSSNTIALTSGTVQTATLTASTACTFTMPTATAGKSFVLMLKQAASTGNGTATFTGVKWGTAGAPTITATAGKMDILSFFSDGTNWYGSISQGYTP